jgi:hypothetical protein
MLYPYFDGEKWDFKSRQNDAPRITRQAIISGSLKGAL